MATSASGTSARSGLRRLTATAIVVTGLVAGCTNDKPSVPSLTAQRRAATAFLAAWRRSLEGTWAIDAVFERRIGTKRVTYDVHEARRPPDHLRVAGGTVEGSVNGRVVACTTGADGALTCRDGGPASPYPDEVRKELDLLSGYFFAANPLYRAEAAGTGCFHLVLRHTILAPPYGQTARFCFDAETGAPSLSEVHKRGSVDVTHTTAVRAEPTAADLTPPAAPGA
ncbi:MAG TPA: hypothetical protein VFA83_04810 [Acidimicrobiales bacterium]|nr:hypothetical protein [Acidimicrobiales bacterium]